MHHLAHGPLMIVCSLALAGVGCTSQAADGPAPSVGDAELTALIEPIRARFDVPALAVALVTLDGEPRLAVVGERRRGSGVAATVDDRWHLGSNGKAMTAVLAARLVEAGIIDWSTTIGETFAAERARIHPSLHEVTLAELLRHQGGVPVEWPMAAYLGDDGPALRARAVRELLREPRGEPGAYSNLGYLVAGAMLERASGRSWRALMREQVFEPLAMDGVGFGGAGTPGEIDQPWAHDARGRPVGAGPDVDNPPVMGPAGRIHADLASWARFARDQVRGARGAEGALLPAAAYAELHAAPAGDESAMGWLRLDQAWAGGLALHHGGSNTMNFANIWLAPERGFAVLVCVNQGGEEAYAATDAVVTAVVEAHLAAAP